MIYYMDSSCLVKRYVNEIGSGWVLSITDPVAGNEIYIVRITGVEVVSAISRRKRDGTLITADASMVIATLKNDLLNEYQIIEVTEQLVNRAMTLADTYGLRGFDAVQLAGACEVQAHCHVLFLETSYNFARLIRNDKPCPKLLKGYIATVKLNSQKHRVMSVKVHVSL